MNDCIRRKCDDLAVRIGLNSDRSLLGSGVVLAPGHKRYALILTAAHIFCGLNSDSDFLCLYFVGHSKDPQKTELSFVQYEDFNELPNDKTAHLYIHSNYKQKHDQYPENDAAILQIPYTPWMSSLPVFQLGRQEIESPYLVGFASKDNISQNNRDFIMDSRFVSLRGDLFSKHVKLINQNNRNLVVKDVFQNNTPFNTNNYKLDGLSGGGIFSYVKQGILFNGAFVTDRIRGEDSFFATDVSVFREMINTIGFEIEYHVNTSTIQKDSLECFMNAGDERAFEWFRKKSDDYLKSLDQRSFFKDSFVSSDSLSCTEYRPACPTYYVGKMIGTVILSSVYGIIPEEVNEQHITINNEEIRLLHICSENPIELVVQEALTGSAFSADGPFRNKSIFVLNGKNPVAYKYVSMGRCQRIITSVLGRMPEDFRYREDYSDLYDLLSENNRTDEYVGFSIIQGDLAKTQIAFLPLKELEAAMENTVPDEELLKEDIDDLIRRVWRV